MPCVKNPNHLNKYRNPKNTVNPLFIKPLWLFVWLLIGNQIYAQNSSFTISGTIKDAESGETLIGAIVSVDNGRVYSLTNEYGFYSLSLPTDSIVLQVSYVGYPNNVHSFYHAQDTVLNIELSSKAMIEEVVVLSSSNQEKINSTQMGMEQINVKEAKEVVALFGEVDVVKVLQLKPGVQSGSEGTTGLYVRGGGADQNHFVLDDATIYNPSHLLGLFSTFNADVVKDAKLYKAGFPAQFGGKLSSVVDVRLREGNRKKLELNGGIGTIAARLTAEGPLKKNKGAFILSGRRAYIDLFTSIINSANKNNPDWLEIPAYNFYDINAKLNYDISPKDRLFLSFYWGKDRFIFRNNWIGFNLSWGNAAASVRWNRTISKKMFVNTSLIFSDYNYNIKSRMGTIDLNLSSGIRDFGGKTDWMWFPSNAHEIRFGAMATYHHFSVGQFRATNGSDIDLKAGSRFDTGEFALYFSDDWTISPKVKVLAGLRISSFYNHGKWYVNGEPRLALKYNIHKRVALKASYVRMNQYAHLVATSGITMPTNTWYPSNAKVAPQASDLVAASLSWALGKDFYINIEGYYKWMHDQVDFRDGAKLFVNNQLEEEFIFGKGWSYGGEVYLEKRNGNLRGWIGYTLSWTWRQFEQANGGLPFHPKQDRRHDIAAVLIWDIPWTGPKFPLTLSASWIYGTGSYVTFPSKRYIQMDITGTNPFQFVPIYTKRGGLQMPAYHRLDLGLVWKLFPKSKKRFKSDLTFSVYNVYDRRNPFFLYIDGVYNEDSRGTNTTQVPEKFQAKIVSLFPIIPSITWNFKW